MIRRFLLLSLVIIVTGKIYSQDITLNRALDWKLPRTFSVEEDKKVLEKGKYLSFEKARYLNHDTRLPYYFELIPIQEKKIKTVAIDILETKTLKNEGILNEIARKSIETEINLQWKVLESRNKSYLQIYFVPLIRNDIQKIEKIKTFKITWNNAKFSIDEKDKNVSFKKHSIFQKGKWLKVSVEDDGVYKMTYEQLKSNGFSNFDQIGVYGNAQGLLPQGNQKFEDKDPKQNSVKFYLGQDGEFNEGDYILFFGKSSHQWEYGRQKDFYSRISHPYSKKNYYFITENAGEGKPLEQIASSGETASRQVSTFVDYLHHEKNEVNLIESGREWFGERFGTINSYDFIFEFPNRVKDEPVKVSTHVAARSSFASEFSLYANGKHINTIPVSPVTFNFTGYYARQNNLFDSINTPEENVNIKLDFKDQNSSSLGWLDFITINAKRELKMHGDQMLFRYRTDTPGDIIEFNISNVQEEITVWDVTDPVHVKEIKGIKISGETASFKVPFNSEYKEFIAFTGEQFFKANIEGSIQNQDLHGLGSADMLIVTKEKFLSRAHELAEMHNAHDGLKTEVVTDKQIYNEFSSGQPDPAAIRNFVRYMYENSTPSDSLRYLLFFGDGSYDNRECHNNGYLITYQSRESLHYSNSFVSDDYFGMLDSTDNIEAQLSGLLDIGIGRLPVNTSEEAENTIEKIQTYLENGTAESWMNKIAFVADDEDNNLHIGDAEQLSNLVTSQFQEFDVDKIYLDAFDQVSNATGTRYPGVNEAINEKVNNGVLLINYIGHGGEHHLAHERVLTKDDIESWSNGNRLPIFMTATCEFTRFDDPSYTSAGEEVFLRKNGGAIALFSTTRLVYSSQNYALNRSFYNYIFQKKSNGKPYRLGDIVRLTKNNAGTDKNKRNFSLFGDPALRLPIGELTVHTDSLVSNDQPTDTLSPQDRISIYGHVRNSSGLLAESYNGPLVVQLKDKKKAFYTKGNDGGNTFVFLMRKNSLFKGKTVVTDGKFKLDFILPKDVDPEFGKGKIIYWGNSEGMLVQGAYEDFQVGGKIENSLTDSEGPDIKLYMNDRNFVSGGVTNEEPVLLVDLKDESGINVSGYGMGHDITATIDNNFTESIQLNEYYLAGENTFKEGTITYQLNELNKGEHTLHLGAWDVNNNYSESSIRFIVAESSEFVLSKIYNQPNPFVGNTSFYFEHNRPDEPMQVTMEIYNLSGKRVAGETKTIYPEGFRVGPIQWDEMNNLGNKFGSGVYIYRIKIRLNDGQVATKAEKLIILK